jgi:hypothetical protein
MSATARLYRRGQWSQSEDGSEEVTDLWEILTTSETDTYSTVLGAAGLPAKGASHPEKTAAIVVTRECKQDDAVLTLWYMTVKYSTAIRTREDAPYATQRVKGGMRSASILVPAFYDTRGYPLVNTAGDLYEGLTRKIQTRAVNVTYNSPTVPEWLFRLADTVNAAAVTIHGETYPALTCALRDVEMPDEPERDNAGNLYWPITYTVEINPLGWFTMLPNKGANELVYQTRTGSAAPWTDNTKAGYDATASANRRIIKRPIQTEEQLNTGGELWLNSVGQAIKVPSLSATQLGTGSISSLSKTLTLSTGSFDATNHKGALVRVYGAGPKGRPLEARIASITSSSVAELEGAAYTTVISAQPVWLSGAIVNQFFLEDTADWSSLPLPNNQP